MPLDFMASQGHYVDHLAPIWGALGESLRGQFVGLGQDTQAALERHGIPASTSFVDRTRPIVLAGFFDVGKAEKQGRQHIALTEHGAGQSYGGDPDWRVATHPCYAGGRRRESVSLFLHPGPHPAARERAAYPKARVEEIGSPFLDTLPLRQGRGDLTVCVSFRWDAQVCPETESGWETFRDAVIDMAQEQRWKIIGHGHPRAQGPLKSWFEGVGIEFVPDFMDVCRRADVYVCDNSSTIFEFASTGRPVVLLNPLAYRPDVEHGLRFWGASGIGPREWARHARLAYTVEEAMDWSSESRESALSLVYSRRSGAAQATADVLEDWMAGL